MFEVALAYFLLIFVPILAIFVYKYINARRDYLVEHKLRYLRNSACRRESFRVGEGRKWRLIWNK